MGGKKSSPHPIWWIFHLLEGLSRLQRGLFAQQRMKRLVYCEDSVDSTWVRLEGLMSKRMLSPLLKLMLPFFLSLALKFPLTLFFCFKEFKFFMRFIFLYKTYYLNFIEFSYYCSFFLLLFFWGTAQFTWGFFFSVRCEFEIFSLANYLCSSLYFNECQSHNDSLRIFLSFISPLLFHNSYIAVKKKIPPLCWLIQLDENLQR